jgi:hypothetical protein
MGKINLGKNISLVKVLQAAYDLSIPAGMGVFHFKPGPLSDNEASEIIAMSMTDGGINFDYIKGRGLKLFIRKETDGSFSIGDAWYDHTDAQLKNLLKVLGVSVEAPKAEHGMSCECNDCRTKRGKGEYVPPFHIKAMYDAAEGNPKLQEDLIEKEFPINVVSFSPKKTGRDI